MMIVLYKIIPLVVNTELSLLPIEAGCTTWKDIRKILIVLLSFKFLSYFSHFRNVLSVVQSFVLLAD